MKGPVEINILTGTLVGSTAADGNWIIQVDTTKYSGTCTYYFEAVFSGAASNTGSIRLRRKGTTTDDATISGATSATVQLTRSTAFTPPSGQTEYIVRNNADGTRSQTIKSARVIIIQDTGSDPLTAIESQFEIGNTETAVTVTTTGTLQKLSAPKYWKYDASMYDGTCTFFGECTYLASSTTGNKTIVIQEAASAEPTATWTTVATMLNASTGAITATRVRSSAFTPVDGRYYRLAWTNSSTMSTVSIYNGKIIVQQTGYIDKNEPLTVGSNQFLDVASIQSVGQSFTGNGLAVSKLNVLMKKTGAPTGTINAKIYAHSGTFGTSSVPTGSALAVSDDIDLSTIGTSAGPIEFIFSGANSITLNSGTNYVVSVETNFVEDASNYIVIYRTASSTHSGNSCVRNGFGVWSENANNDLLFILLSSTNPNGITKAERQRLLANTTFAAGTALQGFLSKWDDAEWDGVNNTYIHQVDAGDNNTSVVEVDTAAGVQVTGSVVSSPDNLGQSSSMTMPANGNLDVKATTNSGNIFGSRIIIRSIKVSTSPISANLSASGTVAGDLTNFSSPGAMQGSASGSGTLAGTLVGVAALASALSGSGVAAGTLVGSGSMASPVSGSGIVSATIKGSAAGAAALSASGVVAGTLQGAAALAATIPNTGVFTGTIRADGALSGSTAAAGSLSGTGQAITQIAGSLAASGSLSGTIIAVSAAQAGISSSGSVSGTLKGNGAIESPVSGSGSVSGSLTGTGQMASPIGSSGSITGNLSGAGSCAAPLSSSGSTSGTLAGTGSCQAPVSGSGVVSGNLKGAADGQGAINASGSLSGTLTGTAALVGAVNGTGSVSGTLSGTQGSAAFLNATAGLSGTLSGSGRLVAPTNGSGSVTGNLSGQGKLSAPLTGSGSMSGSLSGGVGSSAGISSSAALSGTLSGSGKLTGGISGTGILTGQISGTRAGQASLSGNVTLSGILVGQAPAAASLNGSAAINATLKGSAAASCPLNATGQCSGVLKGTGDIIAAIQSTAAVFGDLTGEITFSEITASLSSSAAVAGNLVGMAPASSGIESTGLVAGTLAGQGELQASIVAETTLSGDGIAIPTYTREHVCLPSNNITTELALLSKIDNLEGKSPVHSEIALVSAGIQTVVQNQSTLQDAFTPTSPVTVHVVLKSIVKQQSDECL